MKKTLALLLPVLLLTSCGNTLSSMVGGKIDCYEVNVRLSDGTTETFHYYENSIAVSEYKSKSGETIYADGISGSFYVFKNRFDANSEVYTFNKLIGYMLIEENYYLDPAAKTLDYTIRFNEFKQQDSSSTAMKLDNHEAYEKAKKGYYPAAGRLSEFGIYLEEDNKSLERHLYYAFGQDSTITYVQKWF